jgi:probable F420-dependent oxidoreductase
MKIGIRYCNTGPLGQPERLVHLAQKAEEVGAESLWTVEHVVVPKAYASAYPYSADGRMPGPENAPIPDPLIWLTYAAAVTSKIRLATGILILPQRHPFYVAKALATLDQLSRGRAILGVGIGWLEEEFRGLGVPWAGRAERTEESIRALRSLWADGAREFAGKHFAWGAVHSNPKPAQKPGVPIVIGGQVPAAARRAARLGDGFFPARVDGLPELLRELARECAAIGRDPREIEVTTGSVGRIPSRDDLAQLGALGVGRVLVQLGDVTRDGVERALERVGNELIARA